MCLPFLTFSSYTNSHIRTRTPLFESLHGIVAIRQLNGTISTICQQNLHASSTCITPWDMRYYFWALSKYIYIIKNKPTTYHFYVLQSSDSVSLDDTQLSQLRFIIQFHGTINVIEPYEVKFISLLQCPK